jgi:hypothetical protein
LYGPDAQPARPFGGIEQGLKMSRIDAILRRFAAYTIYPSAVRNLAAKFAAAP